MAAATCPRCTSVVALHEGRPHVTASGCIELWHSACWQHRDQPLPVEPTFVEPIVVAPPISRRHAKPRSRLVLAGGVAGVLVIGLAIARAANGGIEEAQVGDDGPDTEVISLRGTLTVHEVRPPTPTPVERLEDAHPIPDDRGTPLDELYPSLRGWVHPITRAEELMPASPGRHFGALRHGVDRTDCGEGHCGIDLDGPLGRPLVAVAAGVVVHVERHELGLDGRSGRFVRIQHDDGTLTSYMHMDQIDDALENGDHVEAGQYLGTLGMTAVEVAHLHFSLEVPNQHGSHDVTFGATHYVDPAPFLVRSTIVESARRRHAIKPAL